MVVSAQSGESHRAALATETPITDCVDEGRSEELRAVALDTFHVGRPPSCSEKALRGAKSLDHSGDFAAHTLALNPTLRLLNCLAWTNSDWANLSTQAGCTLLMSTSTGDIASSIGIHQCDIPLYP